MKRNNKGSILGLTTVVSLVVTILISIVILLVLVEYSSTMKDSKKKIARIEIEKVAQELYVEIRQDILSGNGIKEIYDVENYIVNIEFDEETKFYQIYLISKDKLLMYFRIGQEDGKLKAWVLL